MHASNSALCCAQTGKAPSTSMAATMTGLRESITMSRSPCLVSFANHRRTKASEMRSRNDAPEICAQPAPHSSSKNSRRCACEDDEAEDEAIDHERPAGEAFKHAHQAPDPDECRDGGNREADNQNRPGMKVEMKMVQLPQFLEAGQGDRRQTQQKREARGLVPVSYTHLR